MKQKLLRRKKKHVTIVKEIQMKFLKTIESSCEMDSNVEVLTFSFQRSLEMPSLKSTDDAYFKRALWMFNFCIFDEVRNRAHMYIWNESIASNGSQEAVSSIYRYICDNVPANTRQIIFFDSCYGKNRNVKVALMLKWILCNASLPKLECIEQRFFDIGHSYNSCDRSFAFIEAKRRKMSADLVQPSDWTNAIATAKKSDPKFTITEMKNIDFKASALDRVKI